MLKIRRLISVVLMAIILLSTISATTLTASADATEKGYDCVAYAKARFREIWGFDLHATGIYNGYYGAQGYYYNAASFGDTISKTPKRGALAVWTANWNVYGHVAIVESVSGNNVTYTEGGYNGHFNRATRNINNMSKAWNDSKYGYCTETFLGYIYVKGTGLTNTKPSASTVSVSSSTVNTYTSFKINWTSSANTGSYNLKYIHNGTYYTLATGTTANSYDVSFSKAGTYSIYVESCNQAGTTQSNVINVRVVQAPSKPTLTVKKGTSSVKTAFSWKKTSNTSHYIIKIKTSAGKTVLNKKVTNLSYSHLLKKGTYSATVTSVCSNGKTNVSSTKKFTISAAPSLNSDGWYYLSYLPANITSDKYTIQYKSTQTKIAKSSPGSNWKNNGLSKEVYENSGTAYDSLVALSTSKTRVLLSYYYFHFCGPSVSNNANYEYTSKYVHYDGISATGLTEASCKNDYDNPSIKFYTLKNSSGNTVYCSSGYSCDGSYGTHGARSPYWYKCYKYQDKKLVKYYKYTKTSGWTSKSDSSADSVKVRYQLKKLSSPKPKASGTSSSITVKWSKVSGASKYIIYRRSYNTSTKKWGSWQKLSTTKSLKYTNLSAKSGVKYQYGVKATNGNSTSSLGSSGTAIRLAATKSVAVKNVSSGVKTSWKSVKGASKYIVYRSTYNKSTKKWSGWKKIKTTTSLSYTDKSSKNNKTYKYAVKAIYSDSKSSLKSSKSIKHK